MKTLNLNSVFCVTLFALVAASGVVFGQQWNGPNNSNDPIYRYGSVGIGTTNPFGKLDVLARQGGTLGSAVASLSHQFVLGGPYNVGPNQNGVKLWIGDYNNDGTTVYPIYIEDENNKVDFWIKNRPTQSGLPTLYFAGNVGIGTANPNEKLDVDGSIATTEGFLLKSLSGNSRRILKFGDSGFILNSDNLALTNTEQNGDLLFMTSPGGGVNNEITRMTIDGATGKVGIGTTDPSANLHVDGVENDGTTAALKITSQYGNTEQTLLIDGNEIDALTDGLHLNYNSNGNVSLAKGGGKVGIGIGNPQATLDVAGTTQTHVLKITGGADLAEAFDVTGKQALKPGLIVSIDPEQPGELRVANKAYDRTVAGIISGAGGVNSGMVMSQVGTGADGKHPVALTGRVYCWADASNGSIQPGDLLTTSDTPGYAMKVADYEKAQGAIIGKAMTSLPEGDGLVLVLVSLQ